MVYILSGKYLGGVARGVRFFIPANYCFSGFFIIIELDIFFITA
jgi:hypothetical protein